MMSLPLAAYTLVQNPEANYEARGFGSAAVLLVLVVVLFGIGRMIGGRGAGQLTSRQLSRRMAASRRALNRYPRRAAFGQPAPPAGDRLPPDYGQASA
jgi:phosphate transport system permease protein